MRAEDSDFQHIQGIIETLLTVVQTGTKNSPHSKTDSQLGQLANTLNQLSSKRSKHQTQKALTWTEKKLDAIRKGADSFITIISRDGTVKFVNRPILSTKVEDAIGQNILALIPPEDQKEHILIINEILKLDTNQTIESRLFTNSDPRYFSHSVSPCVDQGKQGDIIIISKDITAIKRLEELDRLRRRHLEDVINLSSDAILICDENAAIQYINHKGIDLFGQGLKDIQGKHTDVLIPGIFNATTDLLCDRHKLQNHFNPGFIGIRKNGKRFPAEVKARKMSIGTSKGTMILLRDRTEAIRQTEELNKLSLVAGELKNAVIMANADLYPIWINKAYTDQTGFELSDVKDKKLHVSFTGKGLDLSTEILDNLDSGNYVYEEIELYTKQGKRYDAGIHATPVMDVNNDLEKVIVIIDDITKRKSAEREIVRQNHELQDFVYILSHNIRSPLSTLLGLVDLFKYTSASSTFQEEIIEKLNFVALRLDQSIIDLNRALEAQKGHNVEYSEVKLETSIRRVLGLLSDDIDQSQAQISLNISSPSSVKVIEAYFENVLHNLVLNSILFRNRRKKLKVNISCSQISDTVMELKVEDNGQGIDLTNGKKERVFEMYGRQNRSVPGKGMGLFLAKSQITTMGGKIDVTSEIGKGAVFTVTLPFK